MSNIAIWSIVTAVFIGLCLCGWYGPAFAMGLAVGIYDLRRVKLGKQTITSYTRALIPTWLDMIIIGATAIGAYLIGGWPIALTWIGGIVVGHINWGDAN